MPTMVRSRSVKRVILMRELNERLEADIHQDDGNKFCEDQISQGSQTQRDLFKRRRLPHPGDPGKAAPEPGEERSHREPESTHL